jgi:hypothetical protein
MDMDLQSLIMNLRKISIVYFPYPKKKHPSCCQTKEVMHQPKVFHLKLIYKVGLAVCYQLLIPVRNRSSTYNTSMRGTSPARKYKFESASLRWKPITLE